MRTWTRSQQPRAVASCHDSPDGAEPLAPRLAIDEATSGPRTRAYRANQQPGTVASGHQSTRGRRAAQHRAWRLPRPPAGLSTGESPPVATTSQMWVLATNRLAEGEPLWRRSWRSTRPPTGPSGSRSTTTSRTAQLHEVIRSPGEREPLRRRSLQILIAFVAAIGREHSFRETAANNYSLLLSELGVTELEIAARCATSRTRSR